MNTQDKLIAALLAAKAHVVRQQFAGKHQQDRDDAIAWIQEYGPLVKSIRKCRRQMPIKWRGSL
tara:strand:+ start:3504 stop:3695 length:192 start_codon:yes stop_codon:yes gene_type:complete